MAHATSVRSPGAPLEVFGFGIRRLPELRRFSDIGFGGLSFRKNSERALSRRGPALPPSDFSATRGGLSGDPHRRVCRAPARRV